ncbi:hypothetical protein [Azohydromonas caseinilytica]|uniref:Uncharacterized protein n=1 Tax=Azohydromonas caseinilytica TaxID=2728836 RepID=A0A848FF32_9BURK|nr:hypothetical protein [Azohydromonas caseinilytica]NML18837.1 hypothetical protein [Azohydromonas caseinilytica]
MHADGIEGRPISHPASGFPRFLQWFIDHHQMLLAMAWLLLLLGVVGMTATAHGPWNKNILRDPGPMETVSSVDGLLRVINEQTDNWPQPQNAPVPGKAENGQQPPPAPDQGAKSEPKKVDLSKFRLAFYFDSLAIVPGYTLLFLIQYLLLKACLIAEPKRQASQEKPLRNPSMNRHEVLFHLMCAVPVAAALFDLAENGMTVRAVEDAASYVLADATVADMRSASVWKWSLLAASCGLLAFLCWQAAKPMAGGSELVMSLNPKERRFLKTALGLAAVAALVFGLFPWAPDLLLAGMAAMGLAWACAGLACLSALKREQPHSRAP